MKQQGNSMSIKERQHRYFSEEFRRKKVSEIDRNITSVSEVCREYEVSRTSVYKWLSKYSQHRKQQIRQIVESLSDTTKLAALQEQVRDLERLIGQKQITIDVLEKTIDLAEKEYGIDIKKKVSIKPWNGSIPTKNLIHGR